MMIIQNALKTHDGVILISLHRHDYQEYNGYFVDGGYDYLRQSVPEEFKDEYEPLNIFDNDDFETKKRKYCWGTKSKDGIKFIKLIDCEIDHLNNILLNVKISENYRTIINSILEDKKTIYRINKINKINKIIHIKAQ